METIKIVPLTPGLYLVATPIGNLRDITLRALDVLTAVDLVACEDTRLTGKLMEFFGLHKKLLSYNDHSARTRRSEVVETLLGGGSVALVSDAGTPLVSDPGYKLVRDCLDLGIPVTPVPGASAPLAALQLSGLPSDAFMFGGFLPVRSGARRTALAEWKDVPGTLIFFETGPRLMESLADMIAVFGNRPAAVVREITKKFEESRRAPLEELLASYNDTPPKGEIVVVIGGNVNQKAPEESEVRAQIREARKTMTVKDAAAFVAEATGLPRKTVYQWALEEKIEE